MDSVSEYSVGGEHRRVEEEHIINSNCANLVAITFIYHWILNSHIKFEKAVNVLFQIILNIRSINPIHNLISRSLHQNCQCYNLYNALAIVSEWACGSSCISHLKPIFYTHNPFSHPFSYASLEIYSPNHRVHQLQNLHKQKGEREYF